MMRKGEGQLGQAALSWNREARLRRCVPVVVHLTLQLQRAERLAVGQA
jgi:hypothetical protein